MGKCYDVEAAVKQCPLTDQEEEVGVIAIVTEDPDPAGDLLAPFQDPSLPFGVVGSVVQFNRVLASRLLATRAVGLLVISYYDDYWIITLA